MTAQVRIYNGAVSNPESNLLRTVVIEEIEIITSGDGYFFIILKNGQIISFETESSKIVIEDAEQLIIE